MAEKQAAAHYGSGNHLRIALLYHRWRMNSVVDTLTPPFSPFAINTANRSSLRRSL
jgi:hypothetical protein